MNFLKDRAIALAAAVLAAVVFAAPAPAQTRGGHGGHGGHGGRGSGAGMHGHPSRPGGRGGFGFSARSRGFYSSRYGGGYLPYYPYPDYGYDDDYGPPPPEQPPLEANAAPQAAAPPAAPPPVNPLVIEYQGDQWVRVANYAEAPVHPPSAQGSTHAVPAPAEAAITAPPRELPPAVLVFRDGHHEEVAGYTIIGPIIYASTNYWSTGSWTQHIPIARLNVPATLKLNQERGGKFSLPSGPNEVIIR